MEVGIEFYVCNKIFLRVTISSNKIQNLFLGIFKPLEIT